MLLLDRRTFDPSRRVHRHGRAVSLATIFDKHYPMLCDMACGANKRMVLDTTDSNRVVELNAAIQAGSTRCDIPTKMAQKHKTGHRKIMDSPAPLDG